MMRRHGRRTLLVGAATLLATRHLLATRRAHAAGTLTVQAASAQIAAIEQRDGGRLGVAVLDTGSGASITHRAEERFPFCSTFKLLAAAAVLRQVDDGRDHLDRRVAYGPADLLEYAPVTKAHVAEGAMALGDLCAAALQWSDNTAANLLLRSVGGPAGLTRDVRALGDAVTRVDRDEPTLNSAIPGDERDTTSPLAMLQDLHTILLGTALSAGSRRQLEAWLQGDRVGDKRLRAGLPPSWRVGDKTGSGDYGTTNTIGILRPPGRAPVLAAVYFTGSAAPVDVRNAVHAEIGRIIGQTFS